MSDERKREERKEAGRTSLAENTSGRRQCPRGRSDGASARTERCWV
jgi:hypothetical protein